MNKVVTITALMSVLFSSPVFSAPPANKSVKNPFVELNGELISVQGAVTSLQDQLNELVGRVNSIEEVVIASEAAIVNLQAQDTILQTLIDQNITDIASINQMISDQQIVNDNLQAQIDSNSGDNTALQAELDANKAFITTLQSAILEVENGSIALGASLQEQIDDNAVKIALLEQDVQQINALKAFNDNLANGTCPNGTAVISVQDNGSYVCGTVDGNNNVNLSINTVYHTSYVRYYSTAQWRVGCPAGYHAMSNGHHTSRYMTSIWRNEKVAYSAFDMGAYNDRSWTMAVTTSTTCLRLTQ